jgi:hypothetical protein
VPAGICLPPEVTDKFKQALVRGKLDPEKLAQLSSAERHKLFSEIVGEGNAKWVNAQLESKLLLKNQQAGLLSWAKNVAGVTPEVRRDLITRINKMDKVLDPEDAKAFYQDLAAQKLGFEVSQGEARQIANMSQRLRAAATKQRPNGTFPSEADRMAYGYAKVDLGEFIAKKKLEASKLSVREQVLAHPADSVSKLAGVSKAIKASLDNSALFRQGWKTLWTNPMVWQKNARKSFHDLYQVGFKNKDVQREVMADIVSRPNYRKYEKMKLAIGNIEEEFPSSIQNKVPILGRGFKASEAAYENFLYRTRADVADKYLQIAEAGGVNINDPKQLASMGKLVNALTGRGSLGAGEGSKAVGSWTNNLFFSIRFLKSNLDTLTAHQLQKDVTPFVRKQAAINLLKIISGTAAALTVAEALLPGSVEKDPRSSNFGKIKVGDTTFDMTGGMGSLAVLVARQISGKTKSTSTGLLTDYGSGYGQQSRLDGVTDFITGKFSPSAAVVRDLMKGENFDGSPITAKSVATSLGAPLPISNTVETAKDPNAAPWVVAMIADGLGIGSSTYSPSRVQNDKELSATMKQFKSQVGATKFKQANDQYNREYQDWLASSDVKEQLRDLPNEEKQPFITAAKTKIQKKIYEQHDFKPTKTKKSDKYKEAKTSLIDSIQ